ncbi:MAG: nickel-dependent lactate racemase [Pyrinomonadaceae bacterium]
MKVHLQYGTAGLAVDIPSENVTVLTPQFVAGLPDEAESFRQAVRAPINAPPLKDLIEARDRVAVVIPDITRPLPSDRLLPWLFAELAHVPAENFTIINGTGSHRANTAEELARMVGPHIAARYRIINHNAHDPATLLAAGTGLDGDTVFLNREYVEADKRIVLGFIEPHFMAGFSGGYKAVFPALAGIDAIMKYHSARVIGDARSTWGRLDENPTQQIVRAHGGLLPVDFCVNVTINNRRQITRFFCGGVMDAHISGCRFAQSTAMVACDQAFPIVVTTNGGYPLDQNLYQTVKGMSAAAQIVEPGGLIITASRCNDGFPDHGNFRQLLFEHDSAQAVLDTVLAPGFCVYDQWEAQILANILLKARVSLQSSMAPADVRRAHIEPITDVADRIRRELARIGRNALLAVLPEGPMTIPYLNVSSMSAGT